MPATDSGMIIAMSLQQLQYFVAVAEEQHVTRAAERLRISQPPLSRQIQALEDELGQPLFERRGRGIVLTAFGRYFAARATAILDHVASVLADSKRWPSSLAVAQLADHDGGGDQRAGGAAISELTAGALLTKR